MIKEATKDKGFLLLLFLVFLGAIWFCVDGYHRFQFRQDVQIKNIELYYLEEGKIKGKAFFVNEKQKGEMERYLANHMFLIKEKKSQKREVNLQEKMPILSLIVWNGSEQSQYEVLMAKGIKTIRIVDLSKKGKKKFYYLKDNNWEELFYVFFEQQGM